MFCFSCRFIPDKGFEGADKLSGSGGGGGRGDGPVAFETDDNFDPFQISKIFDTLKGDKKRDQAQSDESNKKRKK